MHCECIGISVAGSSPAKQNRISQGMPKYRGRKAPPAECGAASRPRLASSLPGLPAAPPLSRRPRASARTGAAAGGQRRARQRKGRLGRALASKQALWAPPASHAARLRPAHAPARCREPVRNLAVRGESAKSGWDARRKPQTGPCGPARICNAADRPSPRFSPPRTGCEQVPQGSATLF